MAQTLISILKRQGSFGAAFGSIILQGAMLCTLIAFKSLYSDNEFAFLIEQIALASLIGSGSTLRLELLLLQDRGSIERGILLTTLLCVAIIVFASLVVVCAINALVSLNIDAGAGLAAMSIGFGLIEAQAFIAVQIGRQFELVLTRLAQGIGLASAALAAILGTKFEVVFGVFCVSLALPAVFWFLREIVLGRGGLSLILPSSSMLLRGASLAASIFINTLFVTLPVLIAAQTQSAALVSDFGLAQRLLTGPITFIRHLYAHKFLSSAFMIMSEAQVSASVLWSLSLGAFWRSVATYFPFALALLALAFLFSEMIGLKEPMILLFIALATLPQSGINAVAGIRTPLKRERHFLFFDIIRVAALAFALLLFTAFSYEARFGVVSATLSLLYLAYIRISIAMSFKAR